MLLRQTGLARAVSMSVLIVALLVAPSLADSATDPSIAAHAMVVQAIDILHDVHKPVEQRRRELRELAERKLDLEWMARASLGNHWEGLTSEQRSAFVALFSAFIEDAYLDRIQDYADLKIDFSRTRVADSAHASVDANVIQPGEDDIPITFMLERSGNEWKIYDVAVDGISMVQNYEVQFDRVIRRRGLSKLMAIMRVKQARLAALLGTTPAQMSDGAANASRQGSTP